MPKPLCTTKHFKLAQRLRSRIRSLSAGDPLPTVAEIKREYGVSQATVERALDRLRREGLVVRPPGQLRVVVAEAGDPAVRRVAMIRPDYPSPTFDELCRAIARAGAEKDWAFDLVSYRKLETLDLKRALGDNDAAILLPPAEFFPPRLLAALRRPRRPIIVIQDPPEGARVSSVQIDDRQVGRLAVEHLAGLGHRRILLLLSEPAAPSGVQRAEGWRQAMETLGEKNLDELVVASGTPMFAQSVVSTYEFFCRWLDNPHPEFTAIFCAAWTGAGAAMRALRERGIHIPEDISLISHGGEGMIGPFLNPPLTAVETDIAAYGKAVVELMERHFAPPHVVEHLLIPSAVVERKTTAPVRVPS
ncbi:MAG TPA: hypothetical protein DCX07_03205 [Phycisphaerales bacterium]|nr:hypothetical protein [Phycisphaerales bacterium]